RDKLVTGVQTCALPISPRSPSAYPRQIKTAHPPRTNPKQDPCRSRQPDDIDVEYRAAYNGPMLALRTHESIGEIDASDWDRLAASANPFVSHAFLEGLERTGCIREAFGWRAQHL